MVQSKIQLTIKMKDGKTLMYIMDEKDIDIKSINRQLENRNPVISFGLIGIALDNIDFYTIEKSSILF